MEKRMENRSRWKIQDGKIHTKRLEINVVHHCNLSCRECSHLSPRLPRFFVSPDQVYKDLSELSRFCRPKLVSLLGGEPLLHPYLLEVVDVVRRSGISERVRVVTNGVFLYRMPDEFWKKVDEVHVTLYPSHPMKVNELAVFEEQARNNSVHLHLRYRDYFRKMFSALGTPNDELVRRVYATCTMARECHALYEEHYYKCSPAIFLPLVDNELLDFNASGDGIKIRDDDRFGEELLTYLSAEEPLEACRYCLGSVGKRFTPEQVDRRSAFRRATTEELIDWEILERLESGKSPSLMVLRWRTWRMISDLISRLPPSVQLSPTIRRVHKALRDKF